MREEGIEFSDSRMVRPETAPVPPVSRKSTASRSNPRHAFVSGARFFRPADQTPAIGRSAGHGVLPRQGPMAAQFARSENVADVVGKPADLGFHQNRDRAHRLVEPLSPVGFV